MAMGETVTRELMLRAVDEASEARNLDDAVLALVHVLHGRLKLWRVAVNNLSAEGDRLVVLAAWSQVDSAFTPGVEVATSITPELQAILAGIAEGKVVYNTVNAGSGSLVDHLLASQGVAAAVGVPLHRDDHGMLYLALSSCETGVLEEIGTPFFRGLAAGIAERMTELARPLRGATGVAEPHSSERRTES